MGKKTKKFIDKKKSVTFHLVHRSQKDPLVVDENAPDRVLVEAVAKQPKGFDSTFHKRKEEERKYGVYFDDDYDYLQHLRSSDEFQAELEPVERLRADNVNPQNVSKNLNLPSSVFESNIKEKVGVLNKAAPVSGPRLDFDPDIAAALDDDFNFDDPENQLDDDFVALASAPPEDGDDEEENSDEYDGSGSEDYSEDEGYERQSKAFTNCSMTSSVIRRNAGLQLIDAQFDRIMESQYEDTEIGALDGDEIDGRIDPNSELLLQLAKEFMESQTKKPLPPPEVRVKLLASDDEDKNEMVEIEDPNVKAFDCQSILSTRTNQSRFQPKMIRESKIIKINRKTGIPEGVLGSNLTAANLQMYGDGNQASQKSEKQMDTMSLVSRISAMSVRSKAETSDERRERKGIIKQLRRERRVERKANTEAFKKEKLLQLRSTMNLRMNCVGKPLV